jgi:hypothetical protein
VSTREKAPTILTAEGARRKIARARDALALADDLLVELYEGRAWDALGHVSWEALVAAELPELRLIKLRAPVRRERARKLLELGATEREIAAATGSSAGTAHNDVAFLTKPAVLKIEQPPVAIESRADQVVRLVVAAGGEGRTSLELMREARCSYGAASGALSRVARQGRVRPSTVSRGGYGVYVAS